MTARAVGAAAAAGERRPAGGLAILVDPVRTTPDRAERLAERAGGEGVGALLVGNSFGGVDGCAEIARALRRGARGAVRVLLFPATASQLVPDVDAVLLLSLVSGRNPQYLIEEHVRAVPFFNRHPEIEVISTAYCLIDGGRVTSVESVSQTRPLPADKPEILAAHLQAASLIGMRAAYLEAGSGAGRPVHPTLVRAAREVTTGPLFVGGGMRHPDAVRAARDAGADYVVVGSRFEGDEEDLAGAVRELAVAARS
ncbi:MAG TPA: geranylgeranylglyceryl/heptaprenylglyceryl phosphate synthase [Gemmatimonadaceae bacterium]|nr:geranylgeranylglyceryl/heptaprenylglyceryl phosphate synthase [Gemmatimonadaceae bacterium]